jgi:hypothetical protein
MHILFCFTVCCLLPVLTGSSGGGGGMSGGGGGLAEIYDSPVLLRSADPLGLPPPPYPEFQHQHSGNVTAALGKTALLNCRVRNVGNKTVRKTTTDELSSLPLSYSWVGSNF